jgi:hypothetical protein
LTDRTVAKRVLVIAVVVAAALGATVAGAGQIYLSYAGPQGRDTQLEMLAHLERAEDSALRMLEDDPEAAGSYLAVLDTTRQRLEAMDFSSVAEMWTWVFPVVFAYTLIGLLIGLAAFIKWPPGGLQLLAGSLPNKPLQRRTADAVPR